MRVDKFLNSVCITKRRAVAEDMCRSGVVFVGDSVAKASKDVRVGDILSIKFTSHTDKYKVLAIPSTKNVPKNEQSSYVEKLQSVENTALGEKNLSSQLSQSENNKENSPSLQGDFGKKREFILTENELNSLCEALPKCGIILLCGDLASGKTTLVQHLARARGVKDAVNSPTFSLMQSYETPQSAIFHYDIYNDGFAGLVQRGLAENLFENGLHLIEWGDENLETWLKKMSLNYLKISIFVLKNKRKYEILEFKNDE